ncbi:MAG TPA: hypothetical protein PLM53_02175 [Spirochaetota bacterium]|nr:hypothetical protein [Spirochaetota bacterium]HPC42869.1 hypothetical protein [Spirochaetota bacterium]HPL16794.1 hypothetical protein [Spirochaetota bacterium]HQF07141.1 hypothetical protein [Spirochaetota bacterium]HQH95878.1 hypothetical protein [Spirochaetota bacterium]
MKSGIRNVSALLACAAAVFFATGLSADQKTILDYYRLLDQSKLSGGKFTFYRDKGAWRVKSPITEAELKPVVDIPGGYLSVSDPGTGGGTYTQETALFLTRSGAAYLGVNETTFNGAYFERAIRFYRHDGKRLVPDDSVLPAVEARLFFKDGYNLSPVAAKVRMGYSLPRKGTTVIVFIDTMLLERAAQSGEFPPKEAKQSRDALNNITHSKIELKWDTEKGRFVIGRTIE